MDVTQDVLSDAFTDSRSACGGHRRAGSDLPTVVLLDLNLPRVSGLDVLTQLRNDPRTRLLPIVSRPLPAEALLNWLSLPG